ncbi:hypothetical protein [Streptomyces sp. NBC_00285]|uniref:hypothetical protein n=1 Tax=Streptomyces sp. NBC_00285 TaxID=2975700 RepID=UPI002E2B32EB|nr:hypothetical protein [Streptomyces sp. NBC_00285]
MTTATHLSSQLVVNALDVPSLLPAVGAPGVGVVLSAGAGLLIGFFARSAPAVARSLIPVASEAHRSRRAAQPMEARR